MEQFLRTTWVIVKAIWTAFLWLEEKLRVDAISFRLSLVIFPAFTCGLLERKDFWSDTFMKQWSAYLPIVIGVAVNNKQAKEAISWGFKQQWHSANLLWLAFVTLLWIMAIPWVPIPWLPYEIFEFKADIFVGFSLITSLFIWVWLLLIINKITSVIGVPLIQKAIDFLSKTD